MVGSYGAAVQVVEMVFHVREQGQGLGLEPELCREKTRSEVGLAVMVVLFLGSDQLGNMDIVDTEMKTNIDYTGIQSEIQGMGNRYTVVGNKSDIFILTSLLNGCKL